jgi:hypothetical protein
MAFDFPANPVPGDNYTSGGAEFTFNGYAWVGGPTGNAGTSGYVLKTGDTMTGFLTLNADPVNPLHAATKQYADTRAVPPAAIGNDGEALVALAGIATWGAPVNCGNF